MQAFHFSGSPGEQRRVEFAHTVRGLNTQFARCLLHHAVVPPLHGDSSRHVQITAITTTPLHLQIMFLCFLAADKNTVTMV